LLEGADGTYVVERAVLEQGDSLDSVSTVLQPLQSSEQKRLGSSRADVSDDSAHLCGPLPGVEGSKTPPEMTEARPRPSVGSSTELSPNESRDSTTEVVRFLLGFRLGEHPDHGLRPGGADEDASL